MAEARIYQGSYVDATIISNRFIDEYMIDANDAQLKIYLYLVRMMNAGRATSVSDLADHFNHTEKDVRRAVKYWEKKGILSLEYDGSKNLSGIHMMDLAGTGARSAVPAASAAPIVATTIGPVPMPMTQAAIPAPTMVSSVSQNSFSQAMTSQAAVQPSMSKAEAPSVPAKPNYSMEQLTVLKGNGSNATDFVFLAETYLEKPLSVSDMQTLLFIKNELKLPDDLIDYLLQYCAGRGKKDFRYIERVGINWKENNITTEKQAARFIKRYEKVVYSVMNQLGKTGAPADKELEYIFRWTGQYGFPLEVILEACDRTVLATDSHRFQYAEGILSSWNTQGIHTKADIQKADQEKPKRYGNAQGYAASDRRKTTNQFNQFPQQEIDFEELEKRIRAN